MFDISDAVMVLWKTPQVLGMIGEKLSLQLLVDARHGQFALGRVLPSNALVHNSTLAMFEEVKTCWYSF